MESFFSKKSSGVLSEPIKKILATQNIDILLFIMKQQSPNGKTIKVESKGVAFPDSRFTNNLRRLEFKISTSDFLTEEIQVYILQKIGGQNWSTNIPLEQLIFASRIFLQRQVSRINKKTAGDDQVAVSLWSSFIQSAISILKQETVVSVKFLSHRLDGINRRGIIYREYSSVIIFILYFFASIQTQASFRDIYFIRRNQK